MNTTHSLPVIMPKVPHQQWSCHSCGNCCRTLVGHLFPEERERIEQQGWSDKLGTPATVRMGREWVLNKREDGACVFLDDDNRCRIHSEYGEDAKPLACRVFPFSVRPVGKGWQASLRFDCPSVIRSQGRPIGRHRRWLESLVPALHHEPPAENDTADLQKGLPGTVDEMNAVIRRFSRWFKRDDIPFSSRLLGASRVTSALGDATLKKVRGPRLAELIDLLFGAPLDDLAASPALATTRQRGMLRQLAFAHAEYVTLAERKSPFPRRLVKRWKQLRHARRFRDGHGPVPRLPGLAGHVDFQEVEAVQPPTADREAVDALLSRYVTARLEGRSVFGRGYYGWPVFTGLAALWLSMAAAGWLARLSARLDGRSVVSFSDVGVALGVVDRAATRVPVLGTFSERTRVVYLLRDDGVARLLRTYSMSEAFPDGTTQQAP